MFARCISQIALRHTPTALLLAIALTQNAAAQQQRTQLREPVYRVAQQQNNNAAPAQNQHPLVPAVQLAQKCLQHIDTSIKDYSATVVKRERIDGQLLDTEYIFVKIRNQPFSVYMYFLGPKAVKGRECIYVAGQNKGQLIAHEGGWKAKVTPTVHIEPNGFLAMRGQRYPITEIGIRNLTFRLIEVAHQDMKHGECDVKFYKGAKINGRVCTRIEVVHPQPRRHFMFHAAQIFVDDELQAPIRFAAWDWPKGPGKKPELIEEYTYLNIKLNNGFTDQDFNERNQNYRFH